MSEEPSKHHARAFFKGAGFTVIDVPRHPQEKRADLMATYQNETHVVEAKGKAPTQAFRDFRADVAKAGCASIVRYLESWSCLSDIVKDAEAQLLITPAPQRAFRLLWISCEHDDADFVLQLFKIRLYGLATLTVWRPPGPSFQGTVRCFYYWHNDFWQCRGIDAAILAGTNRCQLCVNEFGNGYAELRNSHLWRMFRDAKAVCDPMELEQNGEAFAIRDSIPRNDQRALWQYVRDHYGAMTSVMLQSQFCGELFVPIEKDTES